MFDGSGSLRETDSIADSWRHAPWAAKATVAAVAAIAAVGAFVWNASGPPALGGAEAEMVSGGQSEELSATASALSEVVVHVVGAVRRPGVYAVERGARVADAIERAGGALGNAMLEAINLARVLEDGEQVYVPTTDEASAAAHVYDGTGIGGCASRETVNLNTATVEELDALPGIGPATAKKIVDDRARNGPFASPEDLMRVPGIGPKKFEALKDLVTTR